MRQTVPRRTDRAFDGFLPVVGVTPRAVTRSPLSSRREGTDEYTGPGN
jgi:hypothetical protein